MGEGGADILPDGPVAIFDDDQHYMASVLAEMIRMTGRAVTLITPAGRACAWGSHTEEDFRTNARLIERGVEIVPNRIVPAFGDGAAETRCIFTDRAASIPAASLVLVTSRAPNDALYHELMASPDRLAEAGVERVVRIGDALAPGLIAHAVHGGHRFARELDEADAPILMEAPAA